MVSTGIAVAVVLVLRGPFPEAASGTTQPAQVSPGPEQLTATLDSPDAEARAAALWQLASTRFASPELLRRVGKLRDFDLAENVRLAATYACGRLATKESACPGAGYDRPPKAKRVVGPKYPAAALSAGVTGTVLVELLISERGTVAHAEVRKSVPGLDDAALEAVKTWTFEPAQKGGKPVACLAEAPVRFHKE